ncbi:MAG TPA: hypothetical protein DCM08_08905, partial [Microscillaceae bacterium]|nr:hypothetical protein [Microscillaceae bacterium]
MYFKKLGLVWIGSMLCFSKLLAQSAVPTFDVSTDYQGRACLIVNLMVNAAEGSQKIFLMSRSTNAQKWQEVAQWRLSHLPERASYSNIPVTFVLFEQPEWFENGQEADRK